MRVKHRDYPIQDCIRQVNEYGEALARRGQKMTVHQKWTCKHCGSRQTMAEENQFFQAGVCEECGGHTIIKKCNWAAIIGITP